MPQDLMTFFTEAQNQDFFFLGIIVLIWLAGIIYHLFFLLRLAFYKSPPPGGSVVPVSVIMVERNEAENLAKNLPGWLTMGYPDYEVLVVDDFSEDNSLTIVGVMRQEYSRLRLTGLNQETRYSQKLSRNLALKAAGREYAVFIHPSMEKPDEHWLPGIAAALDGPAELAVGYTRKKPTGPFFHKLYRIESFFQQTESLSYCLNGLPYVTAEENIAFRKQLYFDINGFAGKIGEEYLNMEMIFNQVIRRKNNRVLMAGNQSLENTLTARKADYNDLLHKYFILKRNLGLKIRLIAGFLEWVKILYYPAIIAGVVFYPGLWTLFSLLFLIHAALKLAAIKRIQNRLYERGIFFSSVIYSVLMPYFRLFINRPYNFKRRNS